MAARNAANDAGFVEETRHPLLIYYNLGRRYRPPALLLMLMGLFMLLPRYLEELQNEWVDPDDLALFGVVVFLVGFGMWLFAWLAIHRAYVQCRSDLLVIRTPFYRVLMSYRRVKHAQPVKVSTIFPRESLKGMSRPLMKPLMPMTAAEVVVTSWPSSRRRLNRMLSDQLFATEQDAWIFIVPDYALLIRQLDAAMQRKAEREQGKAANYEDPFERLKYYA